MVTLICAIDLEIISFKVKMCILRILQFSICFFKLNLLSLKYFSDMKCAILGMLNTLCIFIICFYLILYFQSRLRFVDSWHTDIAYIFSKQ